jgi:S-DNA-T family DNA segregation ATPase FtsK/SpoIIIE
MRYEEQKRLQEKDRAKHLFLFFINGFKELIRNPWKNLLVLMYLVVVIIIWTWKNSSFALIQILPFGRTLETVMSIGVITLFILLFVYLMIAIGIPIRSKQIYDDLILKRFVNAAGEPPLLYARYKLKTKSYITIMEFHRKSIPLYQFEEKQKDLEDAIKKEIVAMELKKNSRRIILYTVPFGSAFARVLHWRDWHISNKDSMLVLGENPLKQITVDISKTAHILLGGSSGSGKSVLLKLMLMQCLKKGAQVIIADFKGGVDFSPAWHKSCQVVLDEHALLEILTKLVDELEKRKTLLKELGKANFEEYKSTNPALQRIIFACDEIAEVLDKTGLSKEQKELITQIESKLSIIARQGRAFGIHLFLATQRPSVDIINGQIKSNINCRICGRADSILSSIILDNAKASEKIPSDAQGLFINQDNEVFQAYLLDDNFI